MICLIGPPGSGKGFQINELSKNFNINIFSFGEYLRSEIANKTKFGEKIQPILENGGTLDFDILFECISLDILKQKNLVLDGFPRNLNQAKAFIKFCSEKNICIHSIIEFCIKDVRSLYLRILKRSNIQRVDDNENIFQERVNLYYKFSPLIKNEFIKNGISYFLLDAARDPQSVYNDLSLIIKDLVD